MPRPKTKAEDIVDKERYARKWLYYEKLNFHKKQAEIEDNETSIEAMCEAGKTYEYAIAVNRQDQLMREAIAHTSEFPWIEEVLNPALYEALQSLPDEQKKLLTYLYVDELNQEQLAAIYGISQQAISRRIIRAHKKIKTYFSKGL